MKIEDIINDLTVVKSLIEWEQPLGLQIAIDEAIEILKEKLPKGYDVQACRCLYYVNKRCYATRGAAPCKGSGCGMFKKGE